MAATFKICKIIYVMTIRELSRIRVVPHTVCSCSQLAGIVPKMLTQSAISWFGKIERGTAHLGLICWVYHHNISPLTDLHWLLVSSKIEYKISCLSTCVNSHTSPPYPSDLCQLYLLLWTLHSYPSSGNRDIQFFGQYIYWICHLEQQPFSLRLSPALCLLKCGCKTYHLSTS